VLSPKALSNDFFETMTEKAAARQAWHGKSPLPSLCHMVDRAFGARFASK
jgi:hypothetical protein